MRNTSRMSAARNTFGMSAARNTACMFAARNTSGMSVARNTSGMFAVRNTSGRREALFCMQADGHDEARGLILALRFQNAPKMNMAP